MATALKVKVRDSNGSCCCGGGICFIQCSTRGGMAELCGFSVYVFPTVPPKKYRIRTLSGGWQSSVWADGCEGSEFIGHETCEWSGSINYSSTTCAVTSTGLQDCVDTGGHEGTVPTDTITNSGLSYVTFDTEPTSITASPNGSCNFENGVFRKFDSATESEVLSDEDSETDAINRIPGIGTWSDYGTCLDPFCCRTTRQIRGAGQFDFEYIEARFQVKGTNFPGLARAAVSVDILRKPYGSGSFFLYQTVEQDATADSMGNFTADFGVIPNDAGYETVVNNVRFVILH